MPNLNKLVESRVVESVPVSFSFTCGWKTLLFYPKFPLKVGGNRSPTDPPTEPFPYQYMDLTFDEVDENETIVRITMVLPRFPYSHIRMQQLDQHPFVFAVWMIARWQWRDQGVCQYLNDLDLYTIALCKFASWNEFLERMEESEQIDSPMAADVLMRMQGA